MRISILLSCLLLLTSCAGSPMHTKGLSPQQLTGVDSYTLCKAATPRELYSPNGNIINEVARRGINCRNIYTYNSGQNFRLMEQGVKLMSPTPSINTSPSYGGKAVGTAFLKREQSSGFNKICFYDRMGSAFAITIGATELCPLTQ